MSKDTYKALVDAMVEQRATELGVDDKSAAFMSVSHELVLHDYDLSVDEVDDGLTDGSGDGQIDALYVLVNAVALSADEEIEIPDKGPLEVDIVIVQSKNTASFEENPLKIIRTTIADLFDLQKSYAKSIPNYSQKLQDIFKVARKAVLATAGRTSQIRVSVLYTSKGGTSDIHSNVKAAAKALETEIASRIAATEIQLRFVGAEELVSISRRPTTKSRSLEIRQSISSDTGDSFVCLVSLKALVAFLNDEKGNLMRSLFDANVRDFLGKTEVNDAIRMTLDGRDAGDFWWFNNGITIVATRIDQKGKMLALEDPLVVNGLQTSNVIYSYMNDGAVDAAKRASRGDKIVIAKIIVPQDEQMRDEVIKATNSQTHIPKPYLRGMDTVHRNIEDHLKTRSLFYERRKNQYKNLGKKRSDIVSLGEMAQSLMAALLFRPADARGRPTSLLKSDDDYKTLFSENYSLPMYENIIQAKRTIMKRLAVTYIGQPSSFRNDVVFHILAYISAGAFKTAGHAASGWPSKVVTEADADAAISAVVTLFQKEGGTDRIAKSPDFQTKVLNAARA